MTDLVQADPKVFFHARPHLIRRKDEEKEKIKPDQALIDDIGTALRFVEEDYAGEIASLISLRASKQITWDLLWAICPPNAIILAPKHGPLHQTQSLKLAGSSYEERPNRTQYFSISGAIITHDGTNFGWGHLDLEIDKFDGAKQIASLAAFPLQYSDECKAITEGLVTRGRRYLSIVDKPTYLEYAKNNPTATSGIKEVVFSDGKRVEEKFNARNKT